jgi:hypothetical protein
MFSTLDKLPFSDCFEDKKVISIDYDETFSLDINVFLNVAKLFESAGFKVICCTCRNKKFKDEKLQFIEDSGIECYFTSGIAKREYLLKRGIIVSIWIDDDPKTIISNTR